MIMEDDSVINVKAGKFVHASSPNMLHENNESFQTRPIFLPMWGIYTAREVWPASGDFMVMSDVL